MRAINPYLNFNGNCEEALNFYKAVFGTEFSSFQRFKDVPGDNKVSAEDQEKILHIDLPLGNGNILMASDALESLGQKLTFGNNFYMFIDAESKEEVNRLFDGLSVGGKIEMPLADTFWGAYFGMFADKFGIRWMIGYTHTQPK